MRIPEKRLCDLCKAELIGLHVKMVYPLSPADRKLIEPVLPSGFNNTLLGIMVATTPNSWSFEFCTGCVDGFLPMLADLKTAAIQGFLEERQRRATAPIGGEVEES